MSGPSPAEEASGRAEEREQQAKDPAEEPNGSPEERADEEQDSAGIGEAVAHDIEELLSEARRERDEYLELARRTRADFENYRRRSAQEAGEAERRGKASLARELIPALDNLERALRSAGLDPDGDAGSPSAGDSDRTQEGEETGLEVGVLLVYRELRATLERAGLEPYDPTGERFDPSWHEALSTRPEDGTDSGVVLETVERGYRLDGQVLRAAKVIVSQ